MGGLGSGRVARPVGARFWEKVKYHERGCWEWTASSHFFNGEIAESPRRFAWRDSKGPIPERAQVRPMCRNARCVRPAHLYLTEPREVEPKEPEPPKPEPVLDAQGRPPVDATLPGRRMTRLRTPT